MKIKKIELGMSYPINESFTILSDFKVTINEKDNAVYKDRDDVLDSYTDYNIGLKYKLNPKTTFRIGYFTQRGNLIASESNILDIITIDNNFVSFGYSHHFDSLTLSMALSKSTYSAFHLSLDF